MFDMFGGAGGASSGLDGVPGLGGGNGGMGGMPGLMDMMGAGAGAGGGGGGGTEGMGELMSMVMGGAGGAGGDTAAGGPDKKQMLKMAKKMSKVRKKKCKIVFLSDANSEPEHTGLVRDACFSITSLESLLFVCEIIIGQRYGRVASKLVVACLVFRYVFPAG